MPPKSQPPPNPLANLPSASDRAFRATSAQPRRLLPSTGTQRPPRALTYTTAPVKPPNEVFLVAGRDPDVKLRIRFDSSAVRSAYLERARAAFGGVAGMGGAEVRYIKGGALAGGVDIEGAGAEEAGTERGAEETGRRNRTAAGAGTATEGKQRKRPRKGV